MLMSALPAEQTEGDAIQFLRFWILTAVKIKEQSFRRCLLTLRHV